ncbi:xanthine and CO dehydrogenase maturation factor [Paramagnetospirillum magneticum]|uniref:Xanthine and CO dehydrogenase maturation factor n=1 Tax=Paramagnetospirillum magneticum (strain ATCC 700264 / AMB-1) TaxID=342108 RepID=Q2W921_PARM1|nr:xanthine and CO dehydrogenase maturation factor [Paramagnetospirillum magneticum]BAE49654.1 Xanthine and CO dehydrogenase maturation factor [Paramagnetospirillum magneticum AMB-1]
MARDILIRGTGEIASAIACHLTWAGCRVALQSSRPPIAIRRRMAFSDAYFQGTAELEGLCARRLGDARSMGLAWDAGEVPLLAMEFQAALGARPWAVLVDARMNKQQAPEPQIGLAPLVIGMGPGCAIGVNVDVAVETSWDQLGQVVRRGSTLMLAGEPRAVLGQARSRFRYAPVAGILRSEAAIGQRVREGQVVARIGDAVVRALFDGIVRGLTHDGVPVEKGNKIAEIDPRPGEVKLAGIDERPRRLAEAVTSIVLG